MDAAHDLVWTPAILIHAISATVAFLLGTIVLMLKKGTRWHKRLGRLWVGTMAIVALSSFLITEGRMFGPYSLIHGLSILTLVSLVGGVRAIRRGDIKGHRATMIALYGLALILTGAFTLLPGRRMHQVLFVDGGWIAALSLMLAVVVIVFVWRLRPRSAG